MRAPIGSGGVSLMELMVAVSLSSLAVASLISLTGWATRH